MPDKYVRINKHYHNDLVSFYKFNVLEGSRVLEIGSGSGYLLASLSPSYGVGIDINNKSVQFAKKKYPKLNFYNISAAEFSSDKKFDYIILSDTLTLVGDIQKIFANLQLLCTKDTRLIITTHSFLWRPLLQIAEALKMKSPSPKDNWLTPSDLETLLYIEGFQVVKQGRRFLFPIRIPLITKFINKYTAPLPLLNNLCLTNTIIARSLVDDSPAATVSVIVPARNEAGNIENLVKETPALGKNMEIVFVENHSTDNTYEKIVEIKNKYKNKDIKCIKSTGIGKADAVRTGFEKASGDVLMILDADLTVSPDELTKFYDVIRNNMGEFVYGSRLVYPLEEDAMRTLNILGNKFFSIVFSWLLGTKIKDTLCGTKVISAVNYKKLAANRSYFGNFDPFGDFDLILGSSKLSLKFVEIPIRYKARTYGSTNISRFKHGIQLLKMVIFSLRKIKFV